MANYILAICLLTFVLFSKGSSALTNAQNSAVLSTLLSGAIQCFGEHPLSAAEMDAIKNKKTPETENAKCFAACVFKRVGIMDNKGNISGTQAVQNAKKVFDKDSVKKLEDFIGECTKVNNQHVNDGAKGCDRAKLAFPCFVNNAQKYGVSLNF